MTGGPGGAIEKWVDGAKRLPGRAVSSIGRLPEPIRAEVRDAARRLTKVRSLDEASALLTHEIERLLTVIAPVFVRYPLRVGPRTGRLVVGLSAGGAALLEEVEAVATFVSAGAAAPAAPVLLAADFVALVVEAYVAASVRVNAIERAGIPVVPEQIASDLARAMSGTEAGPTRDVTQQIVSGIAKRVLKRWAVGVTPLAGIAYDGWDAQKTVAAIARMPLPPRVPRLEDWPGELGR